MATTVVRAPITTGDNGLASSGFTQVGHGRASFQSPIPVLQNYPHPEPQSIAAPSTFTRLPQQVNYASTIHVDLLGKTIPATLHDWFDIRIKVETRGSKSENNKGRGYFNRVSTIPVKQGDKTKAFLSNVWIGWVDDEHARAMVKCKDDKTLWVQTKAKLSISGSEGNHGRLYWDLRDPRFRVKNFAGHFISWADETLTFEIDGKNEGLTGKM